MRTSFTPKGEDHIDVLSGVAHCKCVILMYVWVLFILNPFLFAVKYLQNSREIIM
jgi:hypothetical protein